MTTLCTVQQNVNPKHRPYRMKQTLYKYIGNIMDGSIENIKLKHTYRTRRKKKKILMG